MSASPALPGTVHDIHAARENAVIDAISEVGVPYRTDETAVPDV
ncbi:hypothetical protein ACSCBZ_22655 [Streptomyces niveiscabiei]|nr:MULTISPECIES: hypothetical protein [Streptomyces]